MFYDNEVIILKVALMEEIVEKHFNHYSAVVQDFYNKNKELGQRDYAILGQKELDKPLFSVAMSMYTGKNMTVKDMMKKNYQRFVTEYEGKILE